ncbi:MAG: pilus assembly protein [Chloroflexi bacterium]|nr:pilus assembly protein [Chloroflexota bacterium]
MSRNRPPATRSWRAAPSQPQSQHARTRLRQDQRGQSLVLFAVMVTFQMLLLAMVVDAAFGFLARRQLQNATDAASRGGANYLAQGIYRDEEISALLTSLTAANGCPSPCSVSAAYITTAGADVGTVGGGSIPSDAAGVLVTAQTSVTSFLAGLIGRSQLPVTADAAALFGSLGAANCRQIFPGTFSGDTNRDGVSFAANDFTIGACYLIQDDEGSPGGGSFGWVDLDGGGGGSSELATWIDNFASSGNTGCTTTITIGSQSASLQSEPGAKASLQDAVANLITSPYSEMTVAAYDAYGTDSGCSNGSTSGSNLCYRVGGFARIKFTDVKLKSQVAQPNPDTTECSQAIFGSANGILGQFVGWVDPNGQINASAQGPAKVVNVIR